MRRETGRRRRPWTFFTVRGDACHRRKARGPDTGDRVRLLLLSARGGVAEGEGLKTVITDETAKRAIGLCYIDSEVLENEFVEVDVRGKRLKAADYLRGHPIPVD